MFPSEGNRGLLSALSRVNEDLGRGPMQELDPSRRGAADVSFVDPYTVDPGRVGASRRRWTHASRDD